MVSKHTHRSLSKAQPLLNNTSGVYEMAQDFLPGILEVSQSNKSVAYLKKRRRLIGSKRVLRHLLGENLDDRSLPIA